MHEMTDEILNFKCPTCDGAVPFNTSSMNPVLKCACGTPIPMLKVRLTKTRSHIIKNNHAVLNCKNIPIFQL